MINLNNKKFKSITNSKNGDIIEGSIFLYKQTGNIIICKYYSESIKEGHLLGVVSEDNTINLSYHQINENGDLKTGICFSTIILQENNKIRIEEQWEWTSGDKSKGFSVLLEC